jgi:hypothetical protein
LAATAEIGGQAATMRMVAAKLHRGSAEQNVPPSRSQLSDPEGLLECDLM